MQCIRAWRRAHTGPDIHDAPRESNMSARDGSSCCDASGLLENRNIRPRCPAPLPRMTHCEWQTAATGGRDEAIQSPIAPFMRVSFSGQIRRVSRGLCEAVRLARTSRKCAVSAFTRRLACLEAPARDRKRPRDQTAWRRPRRCGVPAPLTKAPAVVVVADRCSTATARWWTP
jgi:hypothetical protein